MKLFKIEVFKILNSKKYIVFCISLIVILTCSIVGIYKETKTELPKVKIENNNKLLIDYRAKSKDNTLSKDIKDDYEKKVKIVEKENIELKKEIENPNYNWKIKLKNNNKDLEESIESSKVSLDYNQMEEDNGGLKVNKYLLKNNIELRKKYEVYGFLDMKDIISSINVIVLPILIVILGYDLISGEIQNSTIKYLASKPIKRENIIICKFFALIFVSFISVFLMEFISFIILGVVFEFGNPMYPMIVGTKYHVDKLDKISAITNTSYMIPIYKYIFKSIAFQFITILPVASLTLLVSEESCNNSISLIISGLITMVLGTITFVIPVSFLKKVYPFLFTTYSDGTKILDGIINLNLETTSINMKLGIIICLIWASFTFFISCRRFKKRDII